MNMASYTINNRLDFLRYNNKSVKRDKKIKEIKIKGIHVFLIVFLFTLIASGIFFFGKFIMTWEKLNINTFTLENSENIDQKLLGKVLNGFRGNILGVNLGEMRRSLMGISQVKDVSISRILPSKIKISFIKRMPILQFEINGKWSIIDEEGIILDRGYNIEKGLIVVKGVSKDHIRDLIPYLSELNSVKNIVDFVSIKRPFGILLKLKNKNITVFPGKSGFKKKIGYFFKLKNMDVLKHLRVTSIDMRFEDRIYLEYEKKDVLNG